MKTKLEQWTSKERKEKRKSGKTSEQLSEAQDNIQIPQYRSVDQQDWKSWPLTFQKKENKEPQETSPGG